MSNDQNEVNFELNLLPVISLLAVLISFLLLTAVWINIGTIDVDQALGNETISSEKNPPSVWAKFSKSGDLTFLLKDIDGVPSRFREVEVRADGRKADWATVESYVARLSERYPEIKTALILPGKRTTYEQMIKMMDQFKKSGLTEIGIAPL